MSTTPTPTPTPTPKFTALRTIREEHSRLSAVIHGMRYFVRKIADGGHTPDLKVFRAMLLYISQYPDRIHHPKEDAYLFAPLRAKAPDIAAVLDALESQHAQGETLVRELEHALAHYEFDGDKAFPAFRDRVETYARFYFDHMQTEEQVVMPAAERALSEAEWQAIDAAFASNVDPLGGTELKSDYERLFSVIANITPAPLGLGASV